MPDRDGPVAALAKQRPYQFVRHKACSPSSFSVHGGLSKHVSSFRNVDESCRRRWSQSDVQYVRHGMPRNLKGQRRFKVLPAFRAA
jgi:hypothetical protein